MAGLAVKGRWDTIQWLLQQLPAKDCVHSVMACTIEAARQGNRDMIQWFLSLPSPPILTEGVIAAAAGNGHRSTVQFLRGLEPPAPWGQQCFEAAARSADANMLEWLGGSTWHSLAGACLTSTCRKHRNMLEPAFVPFMGPHAGSPSSLLATSVWDLLTMSSWRRLPVQLEIKTKLSTILRGHVWR